MGATHIITTPGPGGTLTRIPVDAGTPEGRAIVEAAGTAAVRLSGAESLAVEREQAVTVEREALVRIVGEPVAIAAAAGLGVADELSLGFARPAFRALVTSSAEERERFDIAGDAILQQSPTAHLAGRVTTALATALFTRGATLFGRGAGAASVAARLTPSGFTAAAGESVGRAFLSRLAARGVNPAIARGLATTAAVTADGALSGLALGITEANIQGTPFEGEQIASHVGIGALLGLGFGVVLGSAGAGFARVRGAREIAQFRRLEGIGVARELPEEFTNMSVRELAEYVSRAPPEAQGWLPRVLQHSGAFPTPDARRAWLQAMDDPLSALGEIGFGNAVSARARELERFANDLPDIVAPLADGGRRARMFGRQATGAGTEGRDALMAQLRVLSGEVRQGTMSRAGRAAVLDAVTQAERATVISVPRRGAARATAVPREGGPLAEAIDDVLENMPRLVANDDRATGYLIGLRANLEAAGESLAPGFRETRRLLDAVSGAAHDIRQFRRVTADGVVQFPSATLQGSLSSSVYTARHDTSRDLFRWLANTDDLLERVATTTTGAEQQAARAAQATVRRLSQDLAETAKQGHLIGSMRFLSNQESKAAGIQAAVGQGTLGLVGAGIGAMLGGVPGAIVGGTLGIGMAVIGHPVGVMYQITALKTSLGLHGQRMAQGVSRVRVALAAPRMARLPGGRYVPRVLVQALLTPSEREEEYDAITARLREYAGNPAMLQSRIEDVTGSIGVIAPDMGGAMAVTIAGSVAYLVDRLPPASMPSLFPMSRRRPSVAEMDDFIRRFEAIEDPLSILDRTADGSLTVAHVEAVQANFPRLYQAIQTEISEIIGSLDTLPAYGIRQRVGLLLGVPADPTLEPAFIFAAQQNYAQTAEQDVSQRGRSSFTAAARVSSDTMSRATSVTHRI